MKTLKILVLILFLSNLIYGQSSDKTFTLNGVVYDLNKARVVATKITIKKNNGQIFKTQTNDSGEYKVVLPFGTYTIEFNQIGFKNLLVTNLIINSEVKKELNVTLEVGRCEDCNGALYGERWDDSAVLSGFFYDSNGAVISNAVINLTDSENKTKIAVTNTNGFYKVTTSNGVYSIEIQAIGFKNYKIDKYKIQGTSKGLNLDIVLETKSCDDPTMDCHTITSN